MSRRNRVLYSMATLSFAGAVGLVALGCGGGKVEQFSATQVTLGPNGKEMSRRIMHVTPDKIRMEMDAPGQSTKMIVLLRKDKGLQWIVNPAQTTYFERSIAAGEWDRALRRDWKVSEEDLGSGEINGFPCTKKKVEMTFGLMGRTTTANATVWVSDRISIPLRTQQENGQVVDLRDVKPGRQPSDLFDLPDGYRKVESLMEALGAAGTRGPGKGPKGPAKVRDGT